MATTSAWTEAGRGEEGPDRETTDVRRSGDLAHHLDALLRALEPMDDLDRSLCSTREELEGLRDVLYALDPDRVAMVEREAAPLGPAFAAIRAEALRRKPRPRSRRDLDVIVSRLRSVVGGARTSDRAPSLDRFAVDYAAQDVVVVLTQLEPALAPLADARGIRLGLPQQPGHTVEADPLHLQKILLALAGDAIGAATPGGRVTVAVGRPTRHEIEVVVVDGGPAPARRRLAPEVQLAGERLALHGGRLVVTRAATGGWRRSARLPLRAPAQLSVRPLTFAAPPDRVATEADLSRSLSVYDEAPAGRARQVKSDFLRMMSHELKTPITAMRLQLQLLERQALSARARRGVDDVRRSERQLLHLVETMLEAARVEDLGVSARRLQLFDPRGLVAQVIAESEPLAAGRDVSIRDRTEGVVPELLTDRDIARLVLLNLVAHALGRAPAGGRIDLRVQAGEAECRFLVADSGAPMPKPARAEALAPLELDDGLAARPGRGSGLGLYLVVDLARALAGSVAFVSGSTVAFTVPSNATAERARP